MAFIPLPGTAETVEAWDRRRTATQGAAGIGFMGLSAPTAAPFVLVSGDYHGKLIWWRGDAACAETDPHGRGP